MTDLPFSYPRASGNAALIAAIVAARTITGPFHRRATGAAMRAFAPLRKTATVVFLDGSRLTFPLGDVYWNGFLWEKQFDYEPEIRKLLATLSDVDYGFIDAGANIGYWSVLVSSKLLGSKPTIAAEASPWTHSFLQRNSENNGCRYIARHAAVYDSDGIELRMSHGPHASRHVTDDSRGDAVLSVTLDTLASDLRPAKTVAKLDVEGAEVAAFNGAKQLLGRDTLFIYEDHGKDSGHRVTKYVMETVNLSAYALNDDGRISPLESPSELTAFKRDRFRGYNFAACPCGTVFERHLRALARKG